MHSNTFHISAHDLVLLGALFITGTFAFLLWFAKTANRQPPTANGQPPTANRFLALALAALILQMVRSLGVYPAGAAVYPAGVGPLQYTLASGPLIYLYSLKITQPEYKFRWRDIWLFNPLLLWIFSVVVYLLLSHRLIVQFYRRQKFSGGDRDRHELRWLDHQLLGFGILWLLWISGMDLIAALMTVGVAAGAFLGREEDVNTRETSEKLWQKGIWLSKTVKANLYYQDPELTLSSLAEKLDMHPHELSHITNKVFKKNFHDFINEFRVAEITRKMKDPSNSHLTLIGMALDAGFNSKTTFNRAFRQIIRKSPAEYMNDLKNKRPTYHLDPYSRSNELISYLKSISMLKNYFKTAWRNMTRNKLTGFINVFGLAIGLSCSLLIWLWLSDELSYNRVFPDSKDIYAVYINAPFNGDTTTSTFSPGPVAEAIQNNIPQVEAAAKMTFPYDILFTVGNMSLKEKGTYATPGFFKVFQFKALDGDPDKTITSVDQVVITRKLAQKYFNTIQAVGKTIRIDNKKDYRVGAVIEDIPLNSTVQFSWVINFKVQAEDWMKTWGNNSFFTYIRLKPNSDLSNTLRGLRTIYPRFASEGFKANYPILQAITDVYLYTEYKNGKPTGNGRIEYIRIFAIVAIFILLIACMNFMNLATARASLRAKEIGVRKVAGAGKASLVGQFMTESLLTCMTATLVAIGITFLLLPAFNHLFDKQIQLNFFKPGLWYFIVILVLVTSIIAGSYPSLFLASFNPLRIFKGNIANQTGNIASVRKGLVIVQFALSAFLIVGMLAVSKQVNYIQNKNLGFDKEHLLYLPLEGDLFNKIEVFQNELNKLPYVVASDPVADLPMNFSSTSGDLTWQGKPANLQTEVVASWTGYGFTKTLGITMAAGRDFSKDFRGDSSTYLINESAAKMMGMQNDAVGKQVQFWIGKGNIIGVMKDFHIASLHTPIKPLILCLAPSNTAGMLIRLHPGQTQQALAAIKKVTTTFNPAYPFEYHFGDETYDEMYKSETQVNALVKYFGLLAVIISCLGLFGMIAFSAERRTKEIGIRKVLGASVFGIVRLLSVESLKIIIISMVIAFPLAYWAVNDWLASFAYKSPNDGWIFFITAILLLIITLVTISLQAIKAAIANPVKSLRTE